MGMHVGIESDWWASAKLILKSITWLEQFDTLVQSEQMIVQHVWKEYEICKYMALQ